MKLIDIKLVNNSYTITYSDNDVLCVKESLSLEEVIDFVKSLGLLVSSIEYEFPDQPKEFTENVTICGMPRGYRNNNLISKPENNEQ